MSGLSAAKAQALDSLVRSLPDGVLATLRSALASEAPGSWSDPVRASADAEAADRRLRDGVLRELVAMSRTFTAPKRPMHPVSPWAAAAVWKSLRDTGSEKVIMASELYAGREYERFERISLQILEMAGDGLDGGAGPFALVAQKLGQGLGGASRVSRLVSLSPLVRASLPRARVWLKSGGQDEAHALRLALSDASALCEEGGPLFIDLLAAQFDERWTGLRLVSAVMEKPGEVFLAGSELGGFAEAVLDTIDDALKTLENFDLFRGREAGVAAAAATDLAVEGLDEIDHWVQLDQGQPWGRRVIQQKKALAVAAETRLKEADGLVGAAMPVQPVRAAGKLLRGPPDLRQPLDPDAVKRAEATLAYVDETRRAAAKGGFGGLRTKVVEALDARVATYGDDLFELMRGSDPAIAAEARARLPLAADFLGMVREPAAAQMLRRRLAAA